MSEQRKPIHVLGGKGQLGQALGNLLGDQARLLSSGDTDLCDTDQLRTLLEADCSTVINCAAYNLVDTAEAEPERAFAVNAFAVRNLARLTAEYEIPLVHVSTDYVFGGDATHSIPFTETDRPDPVSVYGASKLTGEYFVRAGNPHSFVVRTCGLYGHAESPDKKNFVKTMLRLGRDRDEIQVVNDQICTPTSTSDLALALVKLIETKQYGLYHATNQGSTTWHEFATEIMRIANLKCDVLPISSREYAAPANRPPYSVLDCGKLEQTIQLELPHWRSALRQFIESMPSASA